ncbi:MAG TPA: GreA/GreB family elongation factor [Candidatus Saccharibacteria bacterium]|nr:GreA/GreB family elongation factor [Candidatus Saccharibacteria bacterium]
MSILGPSKRQEHFLLPHEISLVERDFAVLAMKQAEHGQLLGEAMAQSSETDHDNAPAEIVVSDQEVLMRRAKPLRKIFERHVFVDYPDEDSEEAVLGSRVTLRINQDDPFTVDVVGYLDSEFAEEDVEQVTYQSPIGHALLGRKAGDTLETDIVDARCSIEIVAVDQSAVAALYGTDAPGEQETGPM